MPNGLSAIQRLPTYRITRVRNSDSVPCAILPNSKSCFHSGRTQRGDTHIQLTGIGASLEGCLGGLMASPVTSETVRGLSSEGAATGGLAGTTDFAEVVEEALSAGLPRTPSSGDGTVAGTSPNFESAEADDCGVEEHLSAIAGAGTEIRCQTALHAMTIPSTGTLLTRKRIAGVILASSGTSSSLIERR